MPEPQLDLKTKTTTSTHVTIAASLMLAVSVTAMFFSLGMMTAGALLAEQGGIEDSAELLEPYKQNVVHLHCRDCSFEPVLAVNPLDENIQYLISSYDNDLLQTSDGWKTIHYNDLDNLLSAYRDAGNTKAAFDKDGKLIIASLFSYITDDINMARCGYYSDSQMGNNPPQLTMNVLSDYTPPGHETSWLCDYPKIAIDNNPQSPYFQNMYIPANLVHFADGNVGIGWWIINSSGKMLNGNYFDQMGAPESVIVGPEGEIYAASFNSFGKIEAWISLDGGKSFVEHDIVQQPAGFFCRFARVASQRTDWWMIQAGPELAVNSAGVLYAVWASPKSIIYNDPSYEGQMCYGKDFDIFVSFSQDKGKTWSNPVKVNDDDSGGDQLFPSIAIDDDNTIYVAFIDHRDKQDESLDDVYMSFSKDGGLNFSMNIKVNDLSAPNSGYRTFGDYMDMLGIGKNNIYVGFPCGSYDANKNIDIDTCVATFPKFLRGDANSDGVVDISDPVYILNNLFQGGETPKCMDAADANDDGSVDISDSIKILFYLFTDDPTSEIPSPGAITPGIDPTQDELWCE